MATLSKVTRHVTKLKPSQTGVLNMEISSLYQKGLHSHPIAIQESTFGLWCNWKNLQQLCDAITLSSCYVNMEQTLLWMSPAE